MISTSANYIVSASHRAQEVLTGLDREERLQALAHAINDLGWDDEYPREVQHFNIAIQSIVEGEDKKGERENE